MQSIHRLFNHEVILRKEHIDHVSVCTLEASKGLGHSSSESTSLFVIPIFFLFLASQGAKEELLPVQVPRNPRC